MDETLTEEDKFQEWLVTAPPSPVAEEKQSATAFQGDAEAILAISENADYGIQDLVDAYKSNTWDDPTKALQIVEDYANKLRQKHPSEENLLSAEETMTIAPIKPGDVNDYIEAWEEKNLAAVKDSTDPFIRAYEDTITKSIEDVATGAFQQTNEASEFTDKVTRTALGAIPGIIKGLGVEKYFERNLRADSNDTLASAVSSGVGSLLSLPIAGVNLLTNTVTFGAEQYNQARAGGASVPEAIASGSIEAANQAIDVVLDKVFLGSKQREAGKFVVRSFAKSLGEGTQEVVQNKISDFADAVGFSEEETNLLELNREDALAFAAGTIVGGASQVTESLAPGSVSANPLGVSPELRGSETTLIDSRTGEPVPQATEDLETNLGLEVPLNVAVVGEPAAGGSNLTTVQDASTGAIGTEGTPVLDTDAQEIVLENPDGTISRVVNGERKQSHTGAIIVSEETAKKIAEIQASTPGGKPVVIQTDDLNRPFVNNEAVQPDLTVSEVAKNPDPVLIPQEESGHVLQYSNRTNELGSVEHAATISQGKTGGVSTAGAQAAAESSIADKLRKSGVLNSHVAELLGLNEDFATGLTYVPTSNDNNIREVNDLFSRFDNNYVAFANDLLSKDYGDITSTEAVAAAIAGIGLSQRADQIRATDPEAAAQYDNLATNLWSASQKEGSSTAQDLQRRTRIPMTGDRLITTMKSEVNDLATVRAAEEIGISQEQVENVTKENLQLDKISEGLTQREVLIDDAERLAQERHDAPDQKVAELEKELETIDSSTSPEITAVEEQLNEIDKQTKETEKRAANLEKEADEIQTAQEQANDRIAELTKKVEEASKKPVEEDTSAVDSLKAKKEQLANPKEAPQVKKAEEKVKAAKDVSEKARARLELTKALNEEKARSARELAAINAEIKAAQEAHAEERKRLKEEKAAEIKAAKEELANAKKEASENKKAEVLAKRKEANELRAEQKRIRAEKEAELREAKKKRAADLAEQRKQKKEDLARAKEERTLTKQLRKEQLAADREKLKEQKEAVKRDRERISQRKDRNQRITDAVNKYKKEFTDKLTPEKTQKINALVQLIQTQTGLVRKNALKELGKTIAEVKGVEVAPGANPLSTFWQANVLSSISTNTSNIVGNLVAPIAQTVRDLATANPSKAYRFIRGWAGAMFSGRTGKDIAAGFRGELDSREAADLNQTDLKDLAGGTLVTVETDPVKNLQKYFGTGKLGKFLSSPAVTLRMLGAMDAVFSRASREGRIARAEPSYAQYVAAKAADYAVFTNQAKNEEAQLKSLGVETPKNFVNMRADELSFAAKPEALRNQISRAVKKDVFQEEGGPRGVVGQTTAAILNAVGNVPIPGIRSTRYLNAKWSPLAALGITNRTLRDNVSVDQIYPLVVTGISSGKTLVINGQEVKRGTTKQLLGNLLEAVTNKQLISLQGESIRPFKYAVGMFVNTSSQILDMSVEMLPGAGYIDKKIGGKWKDYTPEEKAQLRGTQIASTVLTGAILASFLPKMGDEENAYAYVYGGMTDEKLRKYYEGKGIKPFSIRVGTTTISYKDIPGINLILGGIGSLADAHMVAKRTPERPLSVGASLSAVAVGSLYAASQLSLLKNISTMADLLTVDNPQTLTASMDVLSNIASGFVPFAGAGRELERFTYGDLSKPKNITNRMLQNIPFAKFVSDVKPALNLFGEPIRATVVPGLSRFVGETKQSFELDWVLRNGYTIKLPQARSPLSKKQLESYTEMQESNDPENFEPYMTEEDQRTYLERVGPELKSILAKYANSDPHGFDPRVQKRLDRDINRMKADIKDDILKGR